MPCLSSSADSDLNESIRVSNAESQLALPLRTTTVFGASVISSPKGSAVCTGAAAAGGAAGVSAAAGGVAEQPRGSRPVPGWPSAPVRRGAAAGAVRRPAPAGGRRRGRRRLRQRAAKAPRGAIAAMPEISASMTRRKAAAAIHSVISKALIRSWRLAGVPAHPASSGTAMLTRKGGFRPMTDLSWGFPSRAGRRRHRFTTLANPPPFAI